MILFLNKFQTASHLCVNETPSLFDVLERLDFETQPFYQFDISVMDGGAVPVKITMAINVVNVNEFPPVFTDTGRLFDGTEWYLPKEIFKRTFKNNKTECINVI